MKWGLEGITFSGNMGDDLRTESVILPTGDSDYKDFINWIVNNISPYYDFYLPREAYDISETLVNYNNAYAGRRFTRAMIDYAQIDEIKRELNDDPISAIEYCYNKNKKSNDGVATTQDWYLPAIDEIEEIMVGGYSEFDVFQDKMYWSCQPAYLQNYLHYDTISGSTDYGGKYFNENSSFARATNAVASNNDFTYAGSGVINDGYHQFLSASILSIVGSPTPTTINGSYTFNFRIGGSVLRPKNESRTLIQAQYDIGYDSRSTQINRVRCVYRSGTVATLPDKERGPEKD